MKKADALIIGSSASGFTAAITARRHYPDATLGLIRQEEKTLIPCGIPYIFGTLGSPEKNLMLTPQQGTSGTRPDAYLRFHCGTYFRRICGYEEE